MTLTPDALVQFVLGACLIVVALGFVDMIVPEERLRLKGFIAGAVLAAGSGVTIVRTLAADVGVEPSARVWYAVAALTLAGGLAGFRFGARFK
jgi:hypothetical protein